ncbi:MAG TPA: phosphate ABC transporter substrate-binding protein, partial [Oceanospirillales bacterium]|nr:phosphate ABC transporter substrate-binding protein [Oceanospirillales bacterium]
MKKVLLTGAALLASVTGMNAHAERDYISIVGSSTVYPFSTVVAERFGKSTNFPTPKVESTGSGGGMKLFCQGVGESTPDITNSSRAIKSSEIALCAENGVKDIVEVMVGYDGIVLAGSNEAPKYELTRKDIFLALAKMVPNTDGTDTLIENPYKTWKDVNPTLPAKKIEVLGPPPTSGTRDAFVELAMEGGCKKFPFIAAMKDADKNKFKAVCHGLREDGGYIEAGENDNLIVQKLAQNATAVGIFGYSFLEENRGKIQAAKVDGIEPKRELISSG